MLQRSKQQQNVTAPLFYPPFSLPGYLATRPEPELDSYTVPAWWLEHCKCDMDFLCHHSYDLLDLVAKSIIKMWIGGCQQVQWIIGMLQCTVANMTSRNSYCFTKATDSPVHSTNGRQNCLPLVLCTETVKESRLKLAIQSGRVVTTRSHWHHWSHQPIHRYLAKSTTTIRSTARLDISAK